jgi:hypothetical protein
VSEDPAGVISTQELLDLPYSRRRIIVVNDDGKTSSAPLPAPSSGSRILRAVAPALLGVGGIAAVAVTDLVKTRREMHQAARICCQCPQRLRVS